MNRTKIKFLFKKKIVFVLNRNMEEARAIFGEDFNFDGIDFNELNEEMDDGDLEDEDEIEEEEEELEAEAEEEGMEPQYDEEGNPIEHVKIKKNLKIILNIYKVATLISNLSLFILLL